MAHRGEGRECPPILQPGGARTIRAARHDGLGVGAQHRLAVDLGRERIRTATALWAAGVLPSRVGGTLGVPLDPQGRVEVRA